MSAAPSVTLLDWQPVAETLADFREECLGFEYEMGQLLYEVGRLHEEADRKAGDLESIRTGLDDWERRLNEQRDQTDQLVGQFEAQNALLAETTKDLETAEANLDRVRHERDVLAQKWEESHRELAQFAGLAAELAQAQGQLAQARGEIQEARETAQLATEEQVQKRDQHWQSQLDELRRERDDFALKWEVTYGELGRFAGLAADLAQARGELADLRAELLANAGGNSQRFSPADGDQLAQALAQQREEMSSELKHLRKLVEKHVESLATRPAAGGEAAGARGGKEPSEQAANPMIGSVMAQFARLQQDVAQRRKEKK